MSIVENFERLEQQPEALEQLNEKPSMLLFEEQMKLLMQLMLHFSRIEAQSALLQILKANSLLFEICLSEHFAKIAEWKELAENLVSKTFARSYAIYPDMPSALEKLIEPICSMLMATESPSQVYIALHTVQKLANEITGTLSLFTDKLISAFSETIHSI